MQISFKGKKVAVAGGSRGIGRSIALAFAAQGADVAICARNAEGLAAAEAELQRHGGEVFTMPCDLADAAAAPRFVEGAASALDGIDILINNASGVGMKDDETGWRASIDVDLMAAMRATQAAIPLMEEAGGGVIINISSISGLRAVPRSLPYAAVKAALINYTKGQGLALASKRIRVNAIAPGSIEFPGGVWDNRKASDPQLYQRTLNSIPWGRFGTPEEIANVVLFLASDLGSWVTGQTIVVDGGQSLS
ncbi:SDR family NAD(P)-dependent oxidoreductase [Rhizobium sp. BK251]|uniref:SDR family NAD(P)-dependent oxidoreductase n=1 Tax=Rhizobium sp. BK251 TaxID=2512125 RepID=UPI001049A6A9|nr:SDR family NAD(P)-dependent oxidoreductase [Rhizobium sp. BK251]TCL73610.1 3-oxoacyl-[acyl-carrier protein] reductase [Rhizobium sp. BK251]